MGRYGGGTRDGEGDVANRLYVSLGRINRTVRRASGQPVVGHGALSALTTLVACGPLRAGELAAREVVSAASMTRIVAALEQVGYATRTRDPADGRAFLVQATAEGERVVREGQAARVESLRQRLDRLPPADRRRLVAALPALEFLAAE